MAKKYENLDGSSRILGSSSILKWKLGLHEEAQPRTPSTGVDIPVIENDGLALKDAKNNALTWIGHASFLIQLGGVSALIDPVMSKRLGPIKRNVSPGLSWDALPTIDVVFITHNHRDHMDVPTLKRLGKEPVYVVPQGLRSWFSKAGFDKVIEMQWWEKTEVNGLQVTFVPAQHWSQRGLNDTNTSLWGGYVIEGGGKRVYHSGDTAWFDGFKEIGQRVGEIHAAMLPIGAYAPRWYMRAQHMNPEDAVQAFKALGAAQFVAMHWGTFKLTDEPLQEPPEFLRRVWKGENLPENRCNVLAIGETFNLDHGAG